LVVLVSLQQAQLRAHLIHDAPASRHGRPQVLYINLNGNDNSGNDNGNFNGNENYFFSDENGNLNG